MNNETPRLPACSHQQNWCESSVWRCACPTAAGAVREREKEKEEVLAVFENVVFVFGFLPSSSHRSMVHGSVRPVYTAVNHWHSNTSSRCVSLHSALQANPSAPTIRICHPCAFSPTRSPPTTPHRVVLSNTLRNGSHIAPEKAPHAMGGRRSHGPFVGGSDKPVKLAGRNANSNQQTHFSGYGTTASLTSHAFRHTTSADNEYAQREPHPDQQPLRAGERASLRKAGAGVVSIFLFGAVTIFFATSSGWGSQEEVVGTSKTSLGEVCKTSRSA